MISASSIDVRALGNVAEPSTSHKLTHRFILKIDGKEVFESPKMPREPLEWKEQKPFRFNPSSNIDILVYRKSRMLGWRKPVLVVEYSGQGIDFLNTGAEQELVHESGQSRLVVKFDLVAESHADFMKAVVEEISQLGKIKGADAAQTAVTISGKIGTVLEAIVPVLDKFAATHPMLNVAWTVLSSAYKVAQNQIAQDASALDMIESMREMAGAASTCPDLLKIDGTTDVIAEIGRVAIDVARLVHDFARPSIRGKGKFLARTVVYTLSDMTTRIAASKQQCEELTKKLSLRIALDTNTIAHDTNARMKETQHGLEKREVQKWIYSKGSDTSTNYNAAQKLHLPGTGSWFLDGPEFSQWKEQPGSVLWLEGGPGSGKTVLSSSAFKNIMAFCESKPLGQGYASFFFDARNGKLQQLAQETFIRSLISQLSHRCGDTIPAALVALYNTFDKGQKQPDLASLEATLLGVLECFDEVYIVIDSFDECGAKEDLLNWIQVVTSKTSRKLHLLVTSRPEQIVKAVLESLSGLQKVDIGERSAESDISALIDAELAKTTKWSDIEKDMIRKGLLRHRGMFRWAALQLHDAIKCRNKKDLTEQLLSLPKDLNATYERTFQRSDHPEELEKFLQWLAFSKRDLTVAEIDEVGTVDLCGTDGPFYDPDMRSKESGTVLTIGSGLVTEINGTVKLAHFSVKEFLIIRLRPVAEMNSCTSEQLSHSIIAQTCLAQLLYFDRESIIHGEPPGYISEDHLVSFPLALYAAEHWVYHFHSAHTNCPHLPKLLLNLFALPRNRAMINWVRLHNPDSPNWTIRWQSESDIASPLYYASVIGLIQFVEQFITDGAQVNAAEGHYGTALQAACARGDIELVRLLLNNKADVNVLGGSGGTALQVASLGGHVKLVKLLLDNKADVNIEGAHYHTALQAACADGHVEVAKLLLDREANVNVAGGSYGTALIAASHIGHVTLAKLLLDNNAEVNVLGRGYGTALQAACARGHIELVRLLLDYKADVNVMAARYVTALIAACVGGHVEVAKLLLENSANVNAVGEKHDTALRAACEGGHVELAKLLRERGALEPEPRELLRDDEIAATLRQVAQVQSFLSRFVLSPVVS